MQVILLQRHIWDVSILCLSRTHTVPLSTQSTSLNFSVPFHSYRVMYKVFFFPLNLIFVYLIQFLISPEHFPPDVILLARYLKVSTWFTAMPPNIMFSCCICLPVTISFHSYSDSVPLFLDFYENLLRFPLKLQHRQQ